MYHYTHATPPTLTLRQRAAHLFARLLARRRAAITPDARQCPAYAAPTHGVLPLSPEAVCAAHRLGYDVARDTDGHAVITTPSRRIVCRVDKSTVWATLRALNAARADRQQTYARRTASRKAARQ